MGILIDLTTSAAESKPFRVSRTEAVTIRAHGLSGSETIKLKSYNQFDSSWEDEDTLTVSANKLSIISSGLFIVTKSNTISPAGASID